jgi:hypothetical protein
MEHGHALDPTLLARHDEYVRVTSLLGPMSVDAHVQRVAKGFERLKDGEHHARCLDCVLARGKPGHAVKLDLEMLASDIVAGDASSKGAQQGGTDIGRRRIDDLEAITSVEGESEPVAWRRRRVLVAEEEGIWGKFRRDVRPAIRMYITYI